jgi:hypothetical protein
MAMVVADAVLLTITLSVLPHGSRLGALPLPCARQRKKSPGPCGPEAFERYQ